MDNRDSALQNSLELTYTTKFEERGLLCICDLQNNNYRIK